MVVGGRCRCSGGGCFNRCRSAVRDGPRAAATAWKERWCRLSDTDRPSHVVTPIGCWAAEVDARPTATATATAMPSGVPMRSAPRPPGLVVSPLGGGRSGPRRRRGCRAGPATPRSLHGGVYTPSMTSASWSAGLRVPGQGRGGGRGGSPSRVRTQRLERDGAAVRGMGRVGELGQGHQERAAPALTGLDLLGERVEQGEDPPSAGRLRRPSRRRRTSPGRARRCAFHVGADQVVLRGEQPVQGRRAPRRPRGDPVDAGGPDAIPVEQLRA